MFPNAVVIGLTLFGLSAVHGFYEVSVTDNEAQVQCPRSGVEDHMECAAPLMQFLNPRSIFAQTSNLEESIDLTIAGGYSYIGTLGRVITKKEGCECGDGTELIPAYLLAKAGVADFLLATNPNDITKAKQSGYAEKRIDFYCSPEANKCGATLALHRHQSHPTYPYSTIYTTNTFQHKLWESQDWKYDGVVCYIWPRQWNSHNRGGQN